MTALPNLTVTLTPPGGSPTDVSAYVAWSGASGNPTITQNFGRQGDTASMVLVDEYDTTPTYVPQPMSQISLRDNLLSQTLFAGVVTDPKLTVTSPNRNEWALSCTDYTCYADAALVQGAFSGWTVDAVVVELTRMANCGISAATIAEGGFVAPGPTLSVFQLDWTPLSQAWRTLAQLAGQVVPFGWYIDENLALHFFDVSNALNSGVTFTTSPSAASAGSISEGHLSWDSFTYEWDATSLRNRVLVQGATQVILQPTTGAATDTWRADGIATAWPLRYTLSGAANQLQVNGATTTVTTVSGGGTGTGAWQAVQNTSGAWFLQATTGPPAAGAVISLWYDYQVPVVAQVNDTASQTIYTGPNGGIFAEFISDSSLATAPMALARAMRDRTEYGFAVERITFGTTEEWFGWVRAGQTCQIVNQFIPDARNGYLPGINSQFIIIQNTITFGTAGYRTMAITGVRL